MGRCLTVRILTQRGQASDLGEAGARGGGGQWGAWEPPQGVWDDDPMTPRYLHSLVFFSKGLVLP